MALPTPYEFKTPIGAGKQTIYHQFESAAGQVKCIVLDISELHKNWGEERVKLEVSKKINWHYKTKDKKDWQFDEVRIINSKGEMKIIKRLNPSEWVSGEAFLCLHYTKNSAHKHTCCATLTSLIKEPA